MTIIKLNTIDISFLERMHDQLLKDSRGKNVLELIIFQIMLGEIVVERYES